MSAPNLGALAVTWALLVFVCRQLGAPPWVSIVAPAVYVALVVAVVTA